MSSPPQSFASAGSPVTSPTPQERMARRFPQPVRVGFLIGLPVIDEDSSIVGRIRRVLRRRDGGDTLVVAYGGMFGFFTRDIAIPVEVVGMLGQFVAAIDMPRAEMDAAPVWTTGGEPELGADESIRVAITKR